MTTNSLQHRPLLPSLIKGNPRSHRRARSSKTSENLRPLQDIKYEIICEVICLNAGIAI